MTRTAKRALEEIPEYAAVVSEQELRQGIERDLTLATAALTQSRGLTPDDLETMVTIGDTRARQGLPLEGMLRVYRITVDEIFCGLWDAVEAGELASEEVLPLTRKVWSYAAAMMDIASAAYRKQELEQALADGQRRSALVHEMLLSASKAPHGAAAALGLDPVREYVAFRARCDSADTTKLMSTLQLPGVLEAGTVAPYEGDLIGLAARRPGLVPEPGVVIGVAPPAPLAALPASFRMATRTVETACAFGLTGVLTLDQLPLHAVARSEVELGASLWARFVEPVQGDAAVLETVRAFLEHDLNADETAEALDVHPNTVRNRLHRYEDLTELSLRSVDALISVRLALLRADLEATER